MPNTMSRRLARREFDAQRRSEQPWRAWYKLAIWCGPRGLRAHQLERQPLCERHLKAGQVVVATVVHHRIDHKGDWALFTDEANLESVCAPCHDKRDEAGAIGLMFDADGWPIR